MPSVIATSNSITSAFFRPSNDLATVTWNRGHRDGFLKNRFRIIVDSGENAVVNGSGLSEKACKKPVLFICR